LKKFVSLLVVSSLILATSSLVGCTLKKKQSDTPIQSTEPDNIGNSSDMRPDTNIIPPKNEKTMKVTIENDLNEKVVDIKWWVSEKGKVICRGSLDKKKSVKSGEKIIATLTDKPNTEAFVQVSVNEPSQHKLNVCKLQINKNVRSVKLSDVKKKGKCHLEK
jgi:hypothetical protein